MLITYVYFRELLNLFSRNLIIYENNNGEGKKRRIIGEYKCSFFVRYLNNTISSRKINTQTWQKQYKWLFSTAKYSNKLFTTILNFTLLCNMELNIVTNSRTLLWKLFSDSRRYTDVILVFVVLFADFVWSLERKTSVVYGIPWQNHIF